MEPLAQPIVLGNEIYEKENLQRRKRIELI